MTFPYREGGRSAVQESRLLGGWDLSVAQQREWIVSFVASAEGHRAVRREARRQGLAWADTDDLYQDWVTALLVTLQNAAKEQRVIDDVASLEQAQRYALRALRNRLASHFRNEQRRPRPVSEPMHHDTESALGAATALERVDAMPWVRGAHVMDPSEPATDTAWCDHARVAISGSLYSGSFHCSGCAAATVASLALALVNRWCAEHVAPPSWGAEGLGGGLTPFDEELYEAMDQVEPGIVSFQGPGVSSKSRQKKRRCGGCVTQLLAAALNLRVQSKQSPEAEESR